MVSVTAVGDAGNFDNPIFETVRMENPPVTNAEAPFLAATPQAFDVSNARTRVPFDGDNDALACLSV